MPIHVFTTKYLTLLPKLRRNAAAQRTVVLADISKRIQFKYDEPKSTQCFS